MTLSPAPTTVTAHIEGVVVEAAELVLSVAVAKGPAISAEEVRLAVDGQPLEVEELAAPDGTRLHIMTVPPGKLEFDYRATTDGSASAGPLTRQQWVEYQRTSRYVESDKLFHVARKQFSGLKGWDCVDAIVDHVASSLFYRSGSSRFTDGAVDTLLAQAGVCRDYAHLTAAYLRANGFPARLVSVYAPGLKPMDFHAVVEVAVDGQWYLLDATRLAPRSTMVRIAYGRDAADTAFLTVQSGRFNFGRVSVTCHREGDLPVEDHATRVQL